MRYSVVIPIYNEEEIVQKLYDRLTAVLKATGADYEILLVNDGSSDSSLRKLEDLSNQDSALKILDLSRNFGHQVAFSAGLDHAAGEAVILMDGDLQDPPEILPDLIARWQEGFEVVYAVRNKRKEFFLKRLAYWAFYRMLRTLSDIEIPLDSGDFSLLDRKVVDQLKAMPERNRFIRGLRTWIGFKQTGLVYERSERYAGKAKYTLSKLFRLALDGLISFSFVPLKLAMHLGFAITFLAFIGMIVYFVKFFIEDDPPGFPTLIITILFMGGIQLLTMGVLGEYVGRIHEEVKSRPLYIVKQKLGFRDGNADPEFHQ